MGRTTGRHLSMLQVAAVFLREVQDQIAKREASEFSLKTALLSTGNYAFADLFVKESIDDDAAAKSMLDEGDRDGIDATTYKFTDQDITADEAEKWLRMMEETEDFTISGSDMEDVADRIPLDWANS